MKILHLGDLHLGLRLCEQPLLEEQRHMLDQLTHIALDQGCQAVMIAGDIYDKAAPPLEAIRLMDDFLTRLSQEGLTALLISGNHDSPERLGFGSRLLDASHVHIAGAFQGRPQLVRLMDDQGPVNFWLLPFIKPALLRPWLAPEESLPESFDGAVRWALSGAEVDMSQRNVLIAHQYVTAGSWQPERAEEEELCIGGLDNVDVSAFDSFDYVALGHLHRAQKVGRDTVRYAGSPLKYSFSEALQHKAATLVELGAKGDIKVTRTPLKPRRDMREIRGTLAQLTAAEAVSGADPEDYLHITLTDEEYLLNALSRLEEFYPHVLRLDYDNQRTRAISGPMERADLSCRDPLELFSGFYELRWGREPSPELSQCFRLEYERVKEEQDETA